TKCVDSVNEAQTGNIIDTLSYDLMKCEILIEMIPYPNKKIVKMYESMGAKSILCISTPHEIGHRYWKKALLLIDSILPEIGIDNEQQLESLFNGPMADLKSKAISIQAGAGKDWRIGKQAINDLHIVTDPFYTDATTYFRYLKQVLER